MMAADKEFSGTQEELERALSGDAEAQMNQANAEGRDA